MADSDEPDSIAPWIENGPDSADSESGTRLEAIPNDEANTITFVPEGSGARELTTTWMTVDADLVFDVTEMN